MIVVDGIATLTAVITAAVAWVAAMAGVAAFMVCVLLFAGCATGTLGTRAPSHRQDRRQSARQASGEGFPAPANPEPSQRRTARHTPAWAHTDHHNHKDAA